MNVIDAIKSRRSIRKYEDRQIPRDVIEKIIEAGLYAPSAGGTQGGIVVAIRNKRELSVMGRINCDELPRRMVEGLKVSDEQPSIIDDEKIHNAFYGAPTVCAIFAHGDNMYAVADTFCIASMMMLAAHELGIGSCVITRAEDTYAHEEVEEMGKRWGVPDDMIPRCFVTFGYCKGEYPKPKPRREGRMIIEE